MHNQHRTLQRLASACGILPSFVDVAGQRRVASPDTIRALLRVMGIDADGERMAADALAQIADTNRHRCIEPVIVQWDKRPKRVRLDEDAKGFTVYDLRFTGGSFAKERVLNTTKHQRRNTRYVTVPSLAFGYYLLEVELGDRTCEALIISAPTKAFAPKRVRGWGAFLPMYAAHTAESWGAGDFSDWSRMARQIAGQGGSVVATLPLLAAFLEKWKCEPSPYSPASRLFWNEFYIDPAQAPEFSASRAARKIVSSSAFKKELDALRKLPLVDYQREIALKRKVLGAMAAELFSPGSQNRSAFEDFLKAWPELAKYAAFRATCERQQRSWHQWPERLRSGNLRPGDYSKAAYEYHLYVQWLAQQQVDGLRGRGADSTIQRFNDSTCRLYLDLPLGVDADGYDVWRHRDSFALGANVGAPPDSFFTKGQDWGFPPLHPRRIRADHYRYVIDYLRFQMQHTGLLRLDHVMGLHRLWWVPHGATAAEGAYVGYTAEEFYAILCLESHLHETMLVGENLGTVPPQVNRSMQRHGLRTMYVVQYEAQPNAKAPLREPPRHCVASLNTHDMPSWAAFWRGLDIADRRVLGLLKASDVAAETKRRAETRRALEKFLQREKLLTGKADARSTLLALLKYLARSPAELVLVNLEDLWLEEAPQNTPGTSTERVNWRRKTKRPVDELLNRPEVEELLRALAR